LGVAMRVGDEQRAPVNGIELAYQELGEPDAEPIVLVMGLATQMIHWDLGFCELLAD
jgi:pimeloyl-ACP methyl ester carboxylesterase